MSVFVFRSSVLWLLLLLLPGCLSRASRPTVVGGDVDVIEFPELLITSSVDAEGERTASTRSVDEVFDEANDYLRADDYANAARLYRFVIDAFTEPAYVRTSYYNLGLALEGDLEFAEAATQYQTVMTTWPGSEDATWAHYRLAECYSKLGDYEAIPALMEAVLPRGGLHHIDRVEAHVRWGNALLEMRRYAEADQQLSEAIELNRRARATWNAATDGVANEPLSDDHAMIAQSHFSRGRIYHELFLEVRLVLPEERLTRDLIDKGQLFEQSQAAYLDCVRTGHRYWGPAAGFMVGQLYEDFYFDILATEIPTHFNELELEIYFEELRTFLEPAMQRAMNIYENNLAMAYRIGADGVWVDDTLSSIHRLQSYLFEQDGWSVEQQLIIERRHPRSAHFADTMVFRSELPSRHTALRDERVPERVQRTD
jgi:tetratricopeptide (TPR) repeat protein